MCYMILIKRTLTKNQKKNSLKMDKKFYREYIHYPMRIKQILK